MPRLPVRNLPLERGREPVPLQCVWAGCQPLLAVRGWHKTRRFGSVEGESYACRGYEKRYNARQCAWDELGIDQATYESGRGSCVWGVFRLIRKIAAMHTLFGNLAGHTCGECRHFISGTYHDRILQKCDLYGLTHSAASDWIKRWPACGLFNRDYHGRPVITQLRRLQPAKSPTEITVPGQMRFDDLI